MTLDLRKPGDTRGVYELAGECRNCGWYGRLLVPRGTRAPGAGFQAEAFCAECGVEAVSGIKGVPVPGGTYVP